MKAGGQDNIFLKGHIDYDHFLPALNKWFYKQLGQIYAKPPELEDGVEILLACPIWGERFVDRFLKYCLPSLLAPGNIPNINSRFLIVIHSDAEGIKKLKRETKHLKRHGVILEFRLIPKRILDFIPKGGLNHYWLLGTCQALYLQYAKYLGLGFHMLMPDHVYSENYFTNLAKLIYQHQLIVQSSVSGDIALSGPELDKHRDGEALAIGAKALMDIAFNNLHLQLKPAIMNGRDLFENIPLSHQFIWIAKDAIHTFCPHSSIAWMSPEIIQRVPIRLHSALDTQLPNIIPPEITHYVPTVQDDMAFAEFSDATKAHHPFPVTFIHFALRFWTTTYFTDGYLTYFGTPNVFQTSPNTDHMTEEEILTCMTSIITALKNCKEEIMALKPEMDEIMEKVA